MPRLDDLLDLMQSTADFYIVNPQRNLRSVYIQTDNFCELALKTWLLEDSIKRQETCIADLNHAGITRNNGHRNAVRRYFSRTETIAQILPNLGVTSGSGVETTLLATFSTHNQPASENPLMDWSPDDPPGRPKSFYDVCDEVVARHAAAPTPASTLGDLLSRIRGRRDIRNQFFHDPRFAGLAVEDKHVLHAFLDLHNLCALIFNRDYPPRLQANTVLRSQIALLKLKHRAYETALATEYYQQVCAERRTINLVHNSLAFEYCFLYEDARTFLERVRKKFDDRIIELQAELDRIERLARKTALHTTTQGRIRQDIQLIENIIAECFDA